MLSRGAVLLNWLINRQVGLCGCVQTQLELKAVPCGAEENNDTQQGKACRYLEKNITVGERWVYCNGETGRRTCYTRKVDSGAGIQRKKASEGLI